MKRSYVTRTLSRVFAPLAAACLLQAGLTGCRESAPDDLIQEEPTTDALVFVKTAATETLNHDWSPGNLYKLSPIAPDGVVTPITNFVGASISDPAVSYDGTKILFSMRPSGSISGSKSLLWLKLMRSTFEPS